MTLEVRRYGTGGPPVVVLHGGPGAPGSARGLARLLAPSFDVLEPLQRRSGAVALTVDQHVADLAEIAPRAAAVVGWSWGAMLAMSYATRHAERVRSIVLVGCGTYSESDRELYRARLDAALGVDGRARRDALQAELASATGAARDRLRAELGELHARAQSFDVIDDDDPEPLPVDARGNEETWTDVLLRQRRGEEPAAFAAIRVPVLMLHGEDDPHPGEATRATLQRYLPQLEYTQLPRCGHTPWLERDARAAFARLLVTWLLQH